MDFPNAFLFWLAIISIDSDEFMVNSVFYTSVTACKSRLDRSVWAQSMIWTSLYLNLFNWLDRFEMIFFLKFI